MSAQEITRVSAEEAKTLVEEQGYTYVDVRTEAEYAAGHPVGAVNVPFLFASPAGMQLNTEFMTVMEAMYAKDQQLLLACKAGGRSMGAARELTAAGYTNLIEMRPGYSGARDPFGRLIEAGWEACGLPVETETAGGTYAELKAQTNSK